MLLAGGAGEPADSPLMAYGRDWASFCGSLTLLGSGDNLVFKGQKYLRCADRTCPVMFVKLNQTAHCPHSQAGVGGSCPTQALLAGGGELS